jgi:hypothetical protein
MKQVANLANEPSLLVKQLDSIILSITDDNVAVLKERNAVGRAEFSRTCARRAPALINRPSAEKRCICELP